MSKEIEKVLGIASVLLLFALLLLVAHGRIRKLEKELETYKNAPADTVTIVEVDTLLYDNPQLIEQYESEKEKVAIEVRRLKKQLAAALNTTADTLEIHDTTTQLVYLPREYMVYKDTNYRAVVSGVQPRLDSLEIYRPTITNTITKYVEKKKKPVFSISVGPGVSYDGKKVKPAIQATAGFVIKSW